MDKFPSGTLFARRKSRSTGRHFTATKKGPNRFSVQGDKGRRSTGFGSEETFDRGAHDLGTSGHLPGRIGHDSHNYMLQVIAYLVNYPDVQKKIQQKINNVIGKDRLQTLQDKGDLPYFRAMVTETLRFNSIFPFLAPHKTTVDTSLRRFNIPKDTLVIFNVWAMHHDPEAWQNPSEFNPSRFIDNQRSINVSRRQKFSSVWRRCSSLSGRVIGQDGIISYSVSFAPSVYV